jgi:spore maturation protein B
MKIISIISSAAMPVFLVITVIYGLIKKVDVYDAFIEGAKKGFALCLRILPYMVAMMFAVSMLTAAGAFDRLSALAAPLMLLLGIPAEVLSAAMLRPFSGGASMGILGSVLSIHGPDSFAGRVLSTFMGSSETLFYTVSLYFGSVGIQKTRYVIPVALITDFFGLILSCLLCRWWFG